MLTAVVSANAASMTARCEYFGSAHGHEQKCHSLAMECLRLWPAASFSMALEFPLSRWSHHSFAGCVLHPTSPSDSFRPPARSPATPLGCHCRPADRSAVPRPRPRKLWARGAPQRCRRDARLRWFPESPSGFGQVDGFWLVRLFRCVMVRVLPAFSVSPPAAESKSNKRRSPRSDIRQVYGLRPLRLRPGEAYSLTNMVTCAFFTKAAVVESLLHQLLGLFQAEATHVDVVDKRQI